MTISDLIITIMVSIVTGMLASYLVSEYYRELYIYKEISNYAKETELYFKEIEYEANEYIQTADVRKLKYLFEVKEVYRKDEFDIKDTELQKAIAQCNSKAYELSCIIEDKETTFERKSCTISLFDFANSLLDINNARVNYDVNEYKRILTKRKRVAIISLVILVIILAIVIA